MLLRALVCVLLISAPQAFASDDATYPGTIQLHVDATDIARHIFEVRQTIPVTGGRELVLLYPQWLPGNHADYGRVQDIGGLKMFAGGQRLNWRRDPINVFAFHVDVPEGISELEVEFQFLSAVDSDKGRVVMTPEMLNLQWVRVLLYPAGHPAAQINIDASVTLPAGWQAATAMRLASTEDNVISYQTTTLETLADSPLFAGKHFKRIDLGRTGDAPVYLNVFADEPESLEISEQQLDIHKAIVTQAEKLFRSHHFDHYEFLFGLTDKLGGIGLEHHQSSENTMSPDYFTGWDTSFLGRDLLAHEYVHSWNGKFRRPADLWTPDFETPMGGSLLWVYEGLTQYYGHVLAARSGLLTPAQSRDALARTAAFYDQQPGREWKSLQDTTTDPISNQRGPLSWSSWSRSEGYYSEGQLIWLDADTLIRELSRGKRSLDDFAAAFFGMNSGSYLPVTYTFDDVVAALNETQPYSWREFLRSRLDGHGPGAPLGGIARSGYELVFTDTPSEYFAAREAYYESNDLTYSLGAWVNNEGAVSSVVWEGVLFDVGMVSGDLIVAVNGTAFTAERLKKAIKDAAATREPFSLLVRDGEQYRTVDIAYYDGLRYPQLQKKGKKTTILDAIYEPR
jgi:predicted metalloprotease with PDZ domain